MDLKNPKHLQHTYLFQPKKESPLEVNTSVDNKDTENPFADHTAPLCKLNLMETSEFVKSFPMAKPSADPKRFVGSPGNRVREAGLLIGQRRSLETPSTPGRPVSSFNATGSPLANFSRKPFPSKWDDAEKWLISSSCNESPAHAIKPEPPKVAHDIQQNRAPYQTETFAGKVRVSDEKVPTLVHSNNGPFPSDQKSTFLDKYADNVEPVVVNFRYCEPLKEGFLFRSSEAETMKDAGTDAVTEIRHRDIGTEMTPLASSRNSRCPTPIKIPSPPRHNTPATRSGPLGDPLPNSAIDISEIQDCHFAKFNLGNQFNCIDLGTSNWSSREEEEEEISKSLRHFEMGTGRRSIGDCKASLWDDEEKTKCCIRYQREEARIQAWVNLQSAKAEAQSRKLEVKIQKMRSNLEEKLMKRMAGVHRKAEEWRAAAQLQHSQHMFRASQQSQKMKSQDALFQENSPCGCFR
ncbi:uncharacterized protein LOC116263862 [Nymphaea colorata]|nr:uncharacterized protein LOC116263862 [Nymphaea colorata]XP_031499524.1 uncharacterized protein LOC116263862 [Nymphaea colorata]